MEKLPSFLAFFLHDLFLLCSFFISHPLILAYFLLLLPYILKLLFLLYPLIFSTFILLLASEFHVTTPSAILNSLLPKLAADEAKVCPTEHLFAMFFSQNCNLLEDSNAKKHCRRASETLRRDRSMPREREWKRTLACKLFEERMTHKLCEEREEAIDGGEEMDLLWEAYEVDADKTRKKAGEEKVVDKEDEDDDVEDDDEGMTVKLCCLQALKLSAGKMSLGVGRPSFVKVSMALKGMSVFHRDGRRRRITI